MARFDLHDMKKQASFFFREKFMDARLALTDVSRIQLLAEEATNSDPWGPETKTLAKLSDAAYELEEYDRIVPVLQSRLEMIEKKPWRQVYKTLVVFEYLLTHGPGAFVNDFRSVTPCIEELCQFTFVDHQGVDRGLSIRKRADQVLELLSKTEVWKEERNRAQKLSHGIKGFGSNSVKDSSQLPVKTVEHQVNFEDLGHDDVSPSTLLSVKETDNEKPNAVFDSTQVSTVLWHPYEKSYSSPVHFRETDSRSSSSEFNPRASSEHKDEFLAAWSPFKKTMSSPGFRDNSRSSWQPFGVDIVRETSDADAHFIASSYAEDSQLLQEESVHRAEKNETWTADLEDVKQHGRKSYRQSVRHVFGLHRPFKHVTDMNLPEKNAKSTIMVSSMESVGSSNSLQSSIESDGSGFSEFAASDHLNISTLGKEVQGLNGSVKPLPLPPPPRQSLRSKLQRHLQTPSLIDL